MGRLLDNQHGISQLGRTYGLRSKNPAGLHLRSRRLLDCALNSRKPNCSAVSNVLLANGIPQNGSGKLTVTRPWRLVSISGRRFAPPLMLSVRPLNHIAYGTTTNTS